MYYIEEISPKKCDGTIEGPFLVATVAVFDILIPKEELKFTLALASVFGPDRDERKSDLIGKCCLYKSSHVKKYFEMFFRKISS